ncbi:MAG: hypothetical protein ABEH43_08820, partial [Flavobacteriales bacterium]
MKYFFPLIFFIILTQISFSQNKNISNEISFQGEPYLAIDPNDPQHLVTAWMGYDAGIRLKIITRVS